jgi:hypothetical protein
MASATQPAWLDGYSIAAASLSLLIPRESLEVEIGFDRPSRPESFNLTRGCSVDRQHIVQDEAGTLDTCETSLSDSCTRLIVVSFNATLLITHLTLFLERVITLPQTSSLFRVSEVDVSPRNGSVSQHSTTVTVPQAAATPYRRSSSSTPGCPTSGDRLGPTPRKYRRK